jgi:hypothetical protein
MLLVPSAHMLVAVQSPVALSKGLDYMWGATLACGVL